MPNWVHQLSALLTVIFGSLATFDWSGLISPAHAALVVTIIGAVKAVASVLAPSAPAAATVSTSSGS